MLGRIRKLSAALTGAALLLGAVALGACREAPRCARRPDHTVIACVDGAPVPASEVVEHLRPAEPVPGRAVLPDPRGRALDAAVQVRLFAAEAARRGLTASGPAARQRSALNQRLIRDEAARAGAQVETITTAEAARYYQAHPGEFNKITSVQVRAIIVATPDRAEALYQQAVGLDEAGFAELARTASEDASAAAGGALGEAHADGVDRVLTRLANDLRARGAIGGPVQIADGRYAILMATEVELAIKPFDDAVALTVKHALAHQRELAVVGALAGRLRAARRVEVFADELARLPAPTR